MKSGSRSERPRGAPRTGIRDVLVLADAEKQGVRGLLGRLEPWLSGRVRLVRIETDVRGFHRSRHDKNADEERPDLIVVVGGDGAILAAVRAFADDPVPTIGINFGRVGFLAAIEAAHWQAALEEALEGRAVVEPRMRLQAELRSGGAQPVRAVALNDVVVTRGAFQGMLSFALKVGDDWLTNYRADGLIVATPSGSTAYSLASGGPILEPRLQDMVVTPICPQALSHRALVLPTDSALTISITHASGITTMVVDGQGFFPMRQGDSIRLVRHPVPYPLLARPDEGFYKRLRERLGWRGSNEPDVFPPVAGPRSDAPDADSGSVL
jgi:NAD+ kinase